MAVIHRITHGFRSVGKSLWILIRQTARIVIALAVGKLAIAGGHARALYLSIHEDMLKLLVAIQERMTSRQKPNPEIDRILIVKLDRIGDMVTTTPVFDALRERYPNARLDIVGHPVVLSLLEGDLRINERIPYSSWLYHPLWVRPPGLRSWMLIARLMFRRYPLIVYLRGSVPFLMLGLSARLAATRYIVAEPVIDRYLKAVSSIAGPIGEFQPWLYISPDNARFARNLLHVNEGDSCRTGPRIVIHAAASSAVKMWPAQRFSAVADDLRRRFDARVHFLGSASDRAMLEAIADLAEENHSYHFTLRLPQSVAVIAEADVFIGNDSGLSHIAAAVGTRAVVLWGPANLPMARPQAPPERCLILYHELSCRNECAEFMCHNSQQLECLMRTQVGDVVQAVARLIGSEEQERFALPLAPAVSA